MHLFFAAGVHAVGPVHKRLGHRDSVEPIGKADYSCSERVAQAIASYSKIDREQAAHRVAYLRQTP